MFLASRFDPFNGEFLLIVLHELAGPTLGYFWALPDTSELSLCTTNSCLSRMLPFSFFSLWQLQATIHLSKTKNQGSYAVNISLNKNHWLSTACEFFAGVSVTPQQTQIKGNVVLKGNPWIKLTKCTVDLPTRMIYIMYFYYADIIGFFYSFNYISPILIG